MNNNQQSTATLLAECKDQAGIIAKVTDFLARYGGNIVDLEQHVDVDDGHFFMRVAWQMERFEIPSEDVQNVFNQEVGQALTMNSQIHFSSQQDNIAVFVSQHGHCLFDILARHQSGEWNANVKLIISNHEKFRALAEQAGVPFHYLPITKVNKQAQEQEQLKLLKSHHIDTIVLARYMQILSPAFIAEYPNKIINIHHSFLPAFPGAKPYHSAYERGVKIIGATSHYVTSELDAGPIIEQDVVHIRHNDSVEDLKRKGQDNEKIVLSRAIRHHLQHQVLVYKNRCIVFD